MKAVNGKLKKLIVVLPLLASIHLSTALSAANTILIDPTKVLTSVFSSEHHNRIIVEEGRIEKAIFPEGHLEVALEPICGHAYINSTHTTPEHVTLSVITENGLCQDIQLSFCKKPSEILVLTEKNQEKINNTPCAHNHIEKIVNSLLKGQEPEKSYFRNIMPMSIKSSLRGIKKTLVSLLESSEESVYIFHLKNLTKKPLSIREENLAYRGTKWVYLGSNILKPRETTIAFIGIPK